MEVADGIYEFSGVSNFYIVLDKEIFVVDTGMPGNADKIIKYLEKELHHEPKDIKTIVITHHHFDHTGSLDKLKMITGAKVAISGEDAEYLTDEKSQAGSALMVPLIKLLNFIYRIKPVNPDIILQEGDHVGDYQVIHTPGHTPGSICLYNPINKVIFTGDNLQYANGKIKGPGSRLIPEPEQYKKSIEKLGELDIEVILTGHGKPVTSDTNKKLDEYINKLKSEMG